ncbi:MAG: short-chain dehydrogenase [Proteobacteria bacterium]|nr:MAG: short-chain dehydrogenase [Pseudomonadota bacterium]
MQQEEASRFAFESTAEDVAAGVDLRGKLAVVTGASGGLGAETARVLASRGARVVLAARDVAKAERIAARIAADTGSDALEVCAVELGSLPSVRACAEAIRARHPAIHLLVNNAGVMACPLARTEQGFELQFGTNHLGHFLLSGLLLPALRAAGGARVVCVSSRGHRFGTVSLDDPNYERRPYEKWEAYGQAKTANIWHALELDRRERTNGVRAFALHPGAIMTELGRHLTAEDIETLRARAGTGGMKWKTPQQGAATQVWAATAPELEGRGGLYLEDCHVAGPQPADMSATGYAPWALDADGAAKLWALSEQLVGAQLG